jgi:hypothetical protein
MHTLLSDQGRADIINHRMYRRRKWPEGQGKTPDEIEAALVARWDELHAMSDAELYAWWYDHG